MKKWRVVGAALAGFPGLAQPLAAHDDPVVPTRAKGNLAALVTQADYPPSALQSRAEGMVEFRIEVGANGRATGCTVTRSSGSAALDSATCRIMRSRARFTPALDSNGQRVADSVAGAIAWTLPRS
jgi:protein TonB